MSQTSDGSAISNCRLCQEPFPSVDARFCSQCGEPRFKRKQCLLCHLYVPDRKLCKNCLAPLNPNDFDYTPLKRCSNSECNAFLVKELLKCYKCQKEQESIPPSVLDLQAISSELCPGSPTNSQPQSGELFPDSASNPQPISGELFPDSASNPQPISGELFPDSASNPQPISGGKMCPDSPSNLHIYEPICPRDIPNNALTGMVVRHRPQSGTIVFHALLPTKLWQWDGQTRVYIKFSHKQIDDWSEPLKVIRGNDDMKELTYDLKMNHGVNYDNTLYRYHVNSAATKGTHQPEYITCNVTKNLPENTHRVLKVRRGYHQYDTAILPQIEEKRINWRMIASTVKNFVFREEDITRKRCLHIYLQDQLKALHTGNIQVSGNDLVSSVMEVYDCLSNMWIQEEGSDIKNTTPILSFQNLEKEIKLLLFSIVKYHMNEKAVQYKKIVVVAALIICCLQKLEIKHSNIHSRDVNALLSLIFIYPGIDYENQRCDQLDILKNLLDNSDELKHLFINGVEACCKRLVDSKSAPIYVSNVLRVAFLVYLIMNKQLPTIDVNQFPNYIQWVPHGQNQVYWCILKAIANRKWDPNCSIQVYHDLESWLTLYPHFLPNFIYSWPSTVYEKLFTVINPFYSISRAALLLNTVNSGTMKRWLHVISLKIEEDAHKQRVDAIQVSQILKSAEYLMESLMSMRLNMPALILQGISLTLQVYSLPVCSSKNLLPEFAKLTFYLSVYVSKEIGGQHFGNRMCESFSGRTQFQNPREFEMWNEMLSLQCSAELMKIWESVVENVLLSRIIKLDSIDGKIEIIANCKAFKKMKPLFKDCITEELEKSFKKFITTPECCISDQSKTTIEQSEIGLAIIKKLLPIKYPDLSLNIEAVLNWDLWPTLLKIQVRHSKTSNSDQDICHKAYVIVANISTCILDGSITVHNLEMIKEKQTRMEKLYGAIFHDKNLGTVPGRFNATLLGHLKKYTTYASQHKNLSVLVQNLPSANIYGLEELKRNLNLDFSEKPISSICYEKNGQIFVFAFQSAAPLFTILDKFTILSLSHRSNTFQKFWNEQIERCHGTDLQIGDVVQHIWNPVFKRCCEHLESLKDRSVKLSIVDELLDQYSEEKLQAEVSTLHRGICECNGSACTSDPSWIIYCVQRMQQYRLLCQHASTAKAFLNLKDALTLTGDFRIIEQLAAQFEKSVSDQCLQFVNESLVETGNFLHGISSDENKLSCLKIFANCQELIKWIKRETRSVLDLQQFITIALTTGSGGEDDYAQDALSNLRTIGNAFATLIYHIPKSTGYKELEENFVHVWESLKHDPTLPQKLSDCGKQIEWYKTLAQKMKGPMEETYIGQMKNINKYGCYIVGCHAEMPCSKLSDIIQMDLQKCPMTLPQQNYTIDELKHLESKLVLIMGNKSNDKEQFGEVLNTVCHIGELLIQLHQQSHCEYVGWVQFFSCNHPNIMNILMTIRKKMTNDLENWQKMVNKTRQKYYCLSYYTTQQLLLLQKELCCIVKPSDVQAGVLSLLQSLSQNVTAEQVVSLIQQVNNDSNEDEDEVDGQNKHAASLQNDCHIKEMSSKEYIADELTILPSIPPSELGENCNLTSKQHEILENLIQAFNFPRKLILLAFERAPNPDIEESVEVWCFNNEKFFQIEQKINATAIEEPELNNYNGSHSIEQQAHSPFSEPMLMKKNHSVVQNVVPALFEHSSQIPLEAAEKHPDDDDLITASLFSDAIKQQSTSTSSECDVIGTDISTSHNNSETSFSLKKLAKLLSKLNDMGPITKERKFPKFLKQGEPNLVVASPDGVLKVILSLYMENMDLPLPLYEEILICNDNTTIEEIHLLFQRALGDPNHFRIFCLAHAELLSYQVCDEALKLLFQCTQGKNDYKLVIVCTNKNLDKSHIVSRLQIYNRPYGNVIYTDEIFSQYLMNHFVCQPGVKVQASNIDPDKSYVRLVTSERPGMGKTLCIKKMIQRNWLQHAVLPIHGPNVTNDDIFKGLFSVNQNKIEATIFHIDISANVLRELDSILFSLLILRAFKDSRGRVWRCHQVYYYILEATILKDQRPFLLSTIALLDLLPKITCMSPKCVLNMLENDKRDSVREIVNIDEIKSEKFKFVHNYLVKIDKSKSSDSDKQKVVQVRRLQVLLKYCGVKDPSWSELNHFVTFLSMQLKPCEESVFCNTKLTGNIFSGLKTFSVKFMIRMSKDFATSSLKGEVDIENQGLAAYDKIGNFQIDDSKVWERNNHSYLFFNKDGQSITFVGFNVSSNGDLLDPVTKKVIEPKIMTPQLYEGLTRNGVDFSKNYDNWIQKLAAVMGLEGHIDPDPTYVLTIDNVIKMMAIYMKFRCNIPVILMGETGCGKTRLIRYMCDLIAQNYSKRTKNVKNMLIMKMHGGISKADVAKQVMEAEELAKTNINLDTILFFDEANTSDAVGLIKEVMCDRRVNGRPIKNDVKFIAACNPYRKHNEEMIYKLESAGLGFYVKANETSQKLGNIPLRQLVYRVLDLPPSMRPFVYDFGQLSIENEEKYIEQIVSEQCQEIPQVKGKFVKSITNVVAWSQQYMKGKKDECSFVSLRDVHRAMLVFKYFVQKSTLFYSKVDEKARAEGKQPLDCITRSLVLAVSVCYLSKLQDRMKYETGVIRQFTDPLKLGGKKQFFNEIKWCQDVLLDNMKLGPNIARNAALKENIFMMVICIELRIPLFLIGKPGSSKSLAKSIIASSMLGKSSESDLMREMKEIQLFSYQCSQLSTSESVVEVFNAAKSFQNKQDVNNFVSIVVLDEVGLAEDSPNLPLKTLHPLLEDGTEGANGLGQVIAHEQRAAFIGISNWALDPAKMNRGVMVTRGDPDEAELELTARGICSNSPNDPVRDRLNPYFKPLSAAYKEIYDEQEKNGRLFFGLRDFYSLIKMLYWMCKHTGMQLTGPQLQHAIKRNFGGLDVKEVDIEKIFKNHIKELEHVPNLNHIKDEELYKFLIPDCSPLGLIRSSLQTKDKSWHGENRYLLFLTENYAALQVLKHYLYKEVGIQRDSSAAGNDDSETNQQALHQTEPFFLFGSSFPKDREFTQVCRNINKIKICMETGRTVILLNLDNLYESLYDLLNQYYIHFGSQKYVDLGLQTHRVKCRVHNDFKLILVAEKKTVYKKFPIPLINRLEKHFVLAETVLLNWQKEVFRELINWIEDFINVQNKNEFSVEDAFVGYKNDTPASVVFQATQQLQQSWGWPEQRHDSEEWKKAVLARSKKILLQMASPDALIRLKFTNLNEKRDKLLKIYYSDQHHRNMIELLNDNLKKNQKGGRSIGLMMQITTHCHLLSSLEIEDLSHNLGKEINCFLLQEFDTEIDFTSKIRPLFSKDKETLLIIQCDSGHIYGDLIAYARYRIEDEKQKITLKQKPTHVLFIINLPHQAEKEHSSSFVRFHDGLWVSAHIDNIRISSESDLSLEDAQSTPISQLFYSEAKIVSDTCETQPPQEKDEMDDDIMEEANPPIAEVKKNHYQCIRLYYCIQTALAKLTENYEEYEQSIISRVKILSNIIPQKPDFPLLNFTTFYGALVKHIKILLQQKESYLFEKEWILDEAINTKKLQDGGTFQNALIRRIDEVIVPLFSHIIFFIDQYANLSFLEEKRNKDYEQQLWLLIFCNEDLVQFNYQNYVSNGHIVNQNPLASKLKFDCQFPFFWLFKNTFISMLEIVPGNKRNVIHDYLCKALSDSAIAIILNKVPEEYSKHLSKQYLGDIIRSSHHITHHLPKQEYEILEEALYSIISGPGFNHKSFLSYLAAVHVIYHEYRQEIMWLGQLTTLKPGILCQVPQIGHNQEHFELPLLMVKSAIGVDGLALPIDAIGRRYVPDRLLKLQQCQNIIDAILNLASYHELAHDIRLEWQRVRVVQLFIEHVAMKCSVNDEQFTKFVQYAKRIDRMIEKQKDFTKKKTLLKIQEGLKLLEKNSEHKMQKQICHCSNSFFMEVVSSLCFGQPSPPETELIRELLNIVLAKEEKMTKEFSFSGKITDKIPVMRSFLLQLLLEHSTEMVKIHLKEYFSRAQQLFQNDSNFYLLYIQCLEDAIYKKHNQMSLADKIEQCVKIFSDGKILLRKHAVPSGYENEITLEFLEEVATLRYSFTIVAELIYYQHHHEKRGQTNASHQLLDMIKKFCFNATDVYGSSIFLAKLLVRNYGFSFLYNLTEDHNMQWVIPKTLQGQGCKNSDPFIIYKGYSQFKAVLLDVKYRNQFTELEMHIKHLQSSDINLLLFGIYEVVTGSAAFKVDKDCDSNNDEAIKKILTAVRNCKKINKELIAVAQDLLSNSYCGRLEHMVIRPGMNPQNRLLTDLVVHVAVVMQHNSLSKILGPFIQMINDPEKLKATYLPTMPEDSLPYVRAAMSEHSGKFYKCQNGHPYFIGDCGRPWTRSTCPVCQSPIGGQLHKADKGNELAKTNDKTETGYALGQPNQREAIPSAERSLSPSACAIMRALMHCSLLWISCTKEDKIQGLLNIIKTDVKPREVSSFFWQHLQHDINMLSTAIGKSQDDACLLVHLILEQINSKNDVKCTITKLETKEKRQKWEKSFSESFIHPVLINLDAKLNEAVTLQLNDKSIENDQLLYAVYEKMEIYPTEITPHLWSYRPYITLENLLQLLQTQKEICPILHEFLVQEPLLRATQYLPNILKLQHEMYQLCHRKYDKKEIAALTIGSYIAILRNRDSSPKLVAEFNKKLNSLRKVWTLVKGKLKDYARVMVDPNLIEIVTWDESTPLTCLIPTLTGQGACTTALVDLMVRVHNEFIEKCHKELTKKDIYWRKYKVPVSHVQCCHLLDYEKQLTSIVLSHCQYSLEFGKGQKINYDLPALEKHLVDRFIHGKPYIQLELLQVMYRKEVYNAETFHQLRKNVQPQIKLTEKQQNDIINELQSINHLRECLDVVEIVIGFLSSQKNSAKTKLRSYISGVDLMRMKKKFSEKALEYCTLGHILSLWEIISVEIAKRHTLRRQEPFDDFSDVLLTNLQDDQIKELESYLKGIELAPFLNFFYEFIETVVRHSEAQNTTEWLLKDTLYARLEQIELDGMLPHNFMNTFPASITVRQSVATWKTIVFYQHRSMHLI